MQGILFARRVRPAAAAAGMLLVLVAAGCGSGRTVGIGGGPSPQPGALSLARDLQPLLSARCAFAGCHGGSSPQMDLNLSAGQAHGELVNVDSVLVPSKKRVAPGDPDGSFLLEKISQDNPSAGSRMPLSGRPLSPEEIDLVRRWIQQGAAP